MVHNQSNKLDQISMILHVYSSCKYGFLFTFIEMTKNNKWSADADKFYTDWSF